MNTNDIAELLKEAYREGFFTGISLGLDGSPGGHAECREAWEDSKTRNRALAALQAEPATTADDSEAEAYRNVLDDAAHNICRALGVEAEHYDQDQADTACYADMLADAARVIEMSGIRFDTEDAEFKPLQAEPVAVLCREVNHVVPEVNSDWFDHQPLKLGSDTHKAREASEWWETLEVFTTPQPAKVPEELRGVAEVLADDEGWWDTCTGCYNSEDGHPAGDYPSSAILKCTLGAGCRECGGLGAVWTPAIDVSELALLTATPAAGEGEES